MEISDNKRKVVLLKGDKDKVYEQAIFVLRPMAVEGDMDIDFVQEAERIINGQALRHKLVNEYQKHMTVYNPSYNRTKMDGNKPSKPKRVKTKLDNFLNGALIVTGAALLSVAAFTFL